MLLRRSNSINNLILYETANIIFNFILTVTLVISINELLKLRYPKDQNYNENSYQYIIILLSIMFSDLIFMINFICQRNNCCYCLGSDIISYYHCYWITNIFKITGFLMILNNIFDHYNALVQIQIFILFPFGGTLISFIIQLLFNKFYKIRYQNNDYEII